MADNLLFGNWNYPTQILFGPGKAKSLVEICADRGIRTPLIVTDKGLATLPIITDIVANFEENQVPAGLFSDVDPNPTGDNVEAGVERYLKGEHDGIIAIGGGSALDAGKAIGLMVGQSLPIWDFEDVGDNYLKVNVNDMAPVIALPTTSGTGSEVGRASVILDQDSQTKKIIFHPNMLPELVVADPELTVALPPHITAATGMDAFIHSLEAFLAPGYHPMADAIALEGMRLVKSWLPKAYRDGTNITARSHMMVASSMGATAFQKGLGGVHALAHPLGAHYGAHHGLLNAILLPYVLHYNRDAINDKIADVAYHLRLEQTSFNGFMAWLGDFCEQLQIPKTLKDIGIDCHESRIIGEQAAVDPSASGNPVELTEAEYASIFINAVEGHF